SSEDEGDGEEDQGLRINEEERLNEEEEAKELYRDMEILLESTSNKLMVDLRRSDNENMLSLVILILRSILTDLQVTQTKPG
nr:hypothetical protein [Tanacetum cinerariifolium]